MVVEDMNKKPTASKMAIIKRFLFNEIEIVKENISELQDYQEWTNKKLLSWKVFDDVSLKSSDITQPNVIATLNNDNKGSLIFYLKDYHQPNKTGLFIGIHSTGVIK